jgi:antitoxin component YwqK of YwqJK toxin-antitoxin module
MIAKPIRFFANGVLQLALLIFGYGCSHYIPPPDTMVAIQIQDRNGFTETISTSERLENYGHVDFLATQPFKKVLRVYKQNGKNHSIITTYHPNGSISQYLEAKEMRASGSYKEWFPNGQMKIDAFVIGGTADITQGAQRDWLFDDICRVWDEDGHLLAKIPYDKGVMEGTCQYFYPSGAVQRQIPYFKNMEEGDLLEFFANGAIKSRTRYEKGVRKGKSLGFFENNAKAWEEEYADGLLMKGMYYTPKGEPLVEVEDGRGLQAHFNGDHLAILMEIRQGAAEGIVKKFTPKDELQTVYFTKCGRKHGEEINYYLPQEKDQEPKPKLSIQYEQGSIHGIVKTWYRNGQLQSQKEYSRNQKLGPACAWYKNGVLMFVEEYEEGGRLQKAAYYKKNQKEPVSTIMNGNGVAYLYDEEGVFLKKITYVKGKPTDPED